MASANRPASASDAPRLLCPVSDFGSSATTCSQSVKASTPDSEIPTDHAIVSILYQVALCEGIRTVVAGTNYSTESIMPSAWSQGHGDWRYIKGVHRRFGSVPLRTYPHRTLAQDIYY